MRGGDGLVSSLIAMLSVLSSGCEPLLGIDFDAVREKSSTSCELKKPKQRPTSDDGPSASPMTFVIAQGNYGDMRQIDGKPEYLSLGYDLDDSCTRHEDPSPCAVPAWIQSDVTDGPSGQDNGVGRILLGQNDEYSRLLINSESLASRERNGTAAPMGVVRISNYNGTQTDPAVTVEWFASLPPQSTEPPFVPGDFAKTERWPVQKAYTELDPQAIGGLRAKIIDQAAYVENFQLVAHFDSSIWSLINAHVEIKEVVVTATITTPPRLLENVTVAGKVSMSEILGASPEMMKQMALGLPVPCTDSLNYERFKAFICIGTDITMGSGNTCDAASFGVVFKAVPAEIGPVVDVPTPEVLCPPELDPRYDSCETLEPQNNRP